MSHTTDESEDGIFSKNQSGLSLTDEGNSGENLGRGIVLKKGPWTSAEDAILVDYVKKHGEGNWNAAQKHSGLFRCGKSCRLRWANHLRPNLKKGSFTADEECLIIELHAKMGNKWARMAAHLPGRTDNEIKNYWNTRIKRRQRAGLPLYPPEVCLQAFQENQSQNTGEINSGDKRHHGLLQTNSYEIPDVVFNGLNADQGLLPFVPELPIISSSSLLMEGLGSSQYCSFMPSTMHRQKRFRESMHLFSSYDGDGLSQFGQIQDDPCNQIERSFRSSFPYDPDPTTKYHLDFGAIQGSHSLINGNFSASKPTSGVVKSELPSFQYPETDLGSWGTSSLPPPLLESVDAFIQSPPPTGAVKSESPSPCNSGLLDALLHQAKTLGNAKNHSSRKSSDSSSVTPCDLAESSTLNLCETEWEDYGESISHFGNSASATSIFSECTPISGGGSSLDEHTPAEAFPGCSVKSEPVGQVWTSDGEKEISTRFSRHEALLGSDWLEQSAGCGKEQTVMTDAITMLLGSDYGSNYKHRGSGTSTLSQGQGWGLGSCAWHNMPAACQMFELP